MSTLLVLALIPFSIFGLYLIGWLLLVALSMPIVGIGDWFKRPKRERVKSVEMVFFWLTLLYIVGKYLFSY